MIPTSRALQALAPAACYITTASGARVRLGVGGFELSAGRAYKIRLIPNRLQELEDVALGIPPEFIESERPVWEHDGEAGWSIPFRVRTRLTSIAERLAVRTGDLTVRYRLSWQPGTHRESYHVPIVAWSWWSEIVMSVVISFLVGTIQGVVSKALTEGGSIWEWRPSLPTFFPWAVGGFAVSILIFWAANRLQMYRRGRELRDRFRSNYSREFASPDAEEPNPHRRRAPT